MQLLLENGVERLMDLKSFKCALQEHIEARERRMRRNRVAALQSVKATSNGYGGYDSVTEQPPKILPPLNHKVMSGGCQLPPIEKESLKAQMLAACAPERPEGMLVKEQVTDEMRQRQRQAPEYWSLTLRQFTRLLQHCIESPMYTSIQRSKGCVTMYDMSSQFVTPWTQGTGCGAAVLMNSERSSPAQLMFSHAWGEDVQESLAACKAFATREGLAKDTWVWFCVFANYQAEDGYGPSIAEQLTMNPFKAVIESEAIKRHSGGHGMCCLHTTKADLYTRLWCVHEMDVAQCNPDVEVRMAMSVEYIREVERRVKLFSAAGQFGMDALLKAAGVAVDTMTAQCSNPIDEEMLIKAILQGEDGFEGLDRRILDLRRKMLPHAIDRVLLRAQILYAGSEEVRIEALHAIVGISSHSAEGLEQAFDIVSRCLQDDSSAVRATAALAVGKLADSGEDQKSMTLLSTCRSDPDSNVRYACIEALQQFASKGHREALKWMGESLRDDDADVRHTAIQALTQVAEAGNEKALALISSCIDDSAFGVRHAAVQALGNLSKKGDRAAIAMLVGRLQDTAVGVRHAAVQALSGLVGHGDHAALRLLAARVLDSVPHVRLSAVRALARVGEDGNQQAIEWLAARMDEASPDARRASVNAVRRSATLGDTSAIALVNARLQDADDSVRLAAEDVFQSSPKA